MKKLLIYSLLILAAHTSICQTTNISPSSDTIFKPSEVLQFSVNQSTELEKGLLQGEALKSYVKQLEAENQSLLAIASKDSVLYSKLKLENESLKNIILLKEDYAAQDKEQDKVTFKRVRKVDQNRWGIGPISGYNLSSNLNLNFSAGFGVSYDIFRF